MNHTEALHLMRLAPAMRDALQAFVDCEDAYDRGDVTFHERGVLRTKALQDAREIVNQTKENSDA